MYSYYKLSVSKAEIFHELKWEGKKILIIKSFKTTHNAPLVSDCCRVCHFHGLVSCNYFAIHFD